MHGDWLLITKSAVLFFLFCSNPLDYSLLIEAAYAPSSTLELSHANAAYVCVVNFGAKRENESRAVTADGIDLKRTPLVGENIRFKLIDLIF